MQRHIIKDDVSLSQKIDLFAQPIQEFFQSKYPALIIGSPELFWLTMLTVILESGTHSKDEVNEAIAQLQQKYSPSAKEPYPFTSALQNFINEAQGCAQEFFSNADYIERELPKIEIIDNLRQMTLRICDSLKEKRNEIFSELQSWKGRSFSSEEFAQRIDKVVGLLSKDLTDLHVLAMSLRAQADIDQRFDLQNILVGESAANIYQAFTRVADIAKEIGDGKNQ